MFEGSLNTDNTKIDLKTAVLFTNGDELVLKTHKEDARLLLLFAPPLKEPIAWGGPIVMNTRQELQEAFEELNKGTFIKS